MLACDREDVAACSRAAERLQEADEGAQEKLLTRACDLHFANCAKLAGFLIAHDGVQNPHAQKILMYRCYAYGLCAEAAWLLILRNGSRDEAAKLFDRHPPNENPAEADIAYARAIKACDLGDQTACTTEAAIGIKVAEPASPAYHAQPTFVPGPATKLRAAFGKQSHTALHALCYSKKVEAACTLDDKLRSGK